MSNVRVRIAPSPTGPDVHVGNVRTALFNYLFAKQNKGQFIFRIEDSDLARSKPEYADAIANSFQWLGLHADEGYKIGGDFGPYAQTEKLDRYKEVAEELIEKGLAYRCYCTADELNALRNSLPEKERERFRYPGICRDRKDQTKGKDYVVRLKAPTDGVIEINDIVFGKIVVPNKENYDYVLMRSNGVPLYNYGCVVDDVDQHITHVIRGRDHIVNTPIQILIYNALGKSVPAMAHLPMMLGPDGTKLSKRHASVSITDYRNAGYSPSGILNYLCRFGWGYLDQEIFSMEQLVELFSLEACKKNDGKFDPKKFAAIQQEHLKSDSLTPNHAYVSGITPFLQKKNITADGNAIAGLLHLVRNRSKTFIEAANDLEPIFQDQIVHDSAAVEKFLTTEVRTNLAELIGIFSATEWNEQSIRNTTQKWLDDKKLVLKDIGQPLRVVITGRTTSPELFQTMAAIGKDKVLNRIKIHT